MQTLFNKIFQLRPKQTQIYIHTYGSANKVAHIQRVWWAHIMHVPKNMYVCVCVRSFKVWRKNTPPDPLSEFLVYETRRRADYKWIIRNCLDKGLNRAMC